METCWSDSLWIGFYCLAFLGPKKPVLSSRLCCKESSRRSWKKLGRPLWARIWSQVIYQAKSRSGRRWRQMSSQQLCVGHFYFGKFHRLRGVSERAWLVGGKKTKNKKPVLGAGSRGPMFDHFNLFWFQQQHEYSSYLFVNWICSAYNKSDSFTGLVWKMAFADKR